MSTNMSQPERTSGSNASSAAMDQTESFALPEVDRVERHELGNELQVEEVHSLENEEELEFDVSDLREAYSILVGGGDFSIDTLREGELRDDTLGQASWMAMDTVSEEVKDTVSFEYLSELDNFIGDSFGNQKAREFLEYAEKRLAEEGLQEDANTVHETFYTTEALESYANSLEDLRAGEWERSISADYPLETLGYGSDADFGIRFEGDLEEVEDADIQAGEWIGVVTHTLLKNWREYGQKDTDDPEMYLHVEVMDDEVVYSIGDNGPGIDGESELGRDEDGHLGHNIINYSIESVDGEATYDPALGIDGGFGFEVRMPKADSGYTPVHSGIEHSSSAITYPADDD